MSNVLEHETLLNETINTLVQKLGQGFANTGDVCDLKKWLLFCERHPREGLRLLRVRLTGKCRYMGYDELDDL